MQELEPTEHYEKVNGVVELFVKGYKVKEIASRLGHTEKDVRVMIEDWKQVVSNDPYIRARALDTVNEAIEHYSSIKERAWNLADRALADEDRRSELAGLKLAGEIEKSKFDMLKQAGVMQDEDILDKVLEIEEQKEKVVALLRDLGPKLCERDRRMVAEELSKLSGTPERIHVD